MVAQMVKHLSTMRETRVRSLGWENPLEKEMATHSSILIYLAAPCFSYGAWDLQSSFQHVRSSFLTRD